MNPLPVIGAPVWFWPPRPSNLYGLINSGCAFAATIVFVHDGNEVSLAGYDHFGKQFSCSHIQLWDGKSDRPDVGRGQCWQWIP